MDTLLETIHGSRLYGLNHATSDQDYYKVVTFLEGTRRKGQSLSVTGGDLFVVPLSRFVEQAGEGVHQALEAMYSPFAPASPLDAFRSSFQPDMRSVRRNYSSAINGALKQNTLKRRKHAVRLALNLMTLLERGRFNPHLSDGQIELVHELAEEPNLSQRLATMLPFDVRFVAS